MVVRENKKVLAKKGGGFEEKKECNKWAVKEKR